MQLIELDGSMAGGQYVRTAIALSTLTCKPMKIINIRGQRTPSGLEVQHLEGIRALAELSNAEVKGLELGSRVLEFHPNGFEEKNLKINISTAGSVRLVLQALLIACVKVKGKIDVEFDGGGTFGKWA